MCVTANFQDRSRLLFSRILPEAIGDRAFGFVQTPAGVEPEEERESRDGGCKGGAAEQQGAAASRGGSPASAPNGEEAEKDDNDRQCDPGGAGKTLPHQVG